MTRRFTKLGDWQSLTTLRSEEWGSHITLPPCQSGSRTPFARSHLPLIGRVIRCQSGRCQSEFLFLFSWHVLREKSHLVTFLGFTLHCGSDNRATLGCPMRGLPGPALAKSERERERERERKIARQNERESERQNERESVRQKEKEWETERKRVRKRNYQCSALSGLSELLQQNSGLNCPPPPPLLPGLSARRHSYLFQGL